VGDLAVLVFHLLTRIARLAGPGGGVGGARISSRCQDVLVNDTAETITAQNTSVTGCRRRCSRLPWLQRPNARHRPRIRLGAQAMELDPKLCTLQATVKRRDRLGGLLHEYERAA
jgi:hypothetical protein